MRKQDVHAEKKKKRKRRKKSIAFVLVFFFNGELKNTSIVVNKSDLS